MVCSWNQRALFLRKLAGDGTIAIVCSYGLRQLEKKQTRNPPRRRGDTEKVCVF